MLSQIILDRMDPASFLQIHLLTNRLTARSSVGSLAENCLFIACRDCVLEATGPGKEERIYLRLSSSRYHLIYQRETQWHVTQEMPWCALQALCPIG